MKYRIFFSVFICALFFFTNLYAQQEVPIEPALMEVHYKHTMRIDTIINKFKDPDSMILRIGKTSSQFFSRYTFFFDSIWNDPKGRAKAEEMTLKAFETKDYSILPRTGTTYDYIYKNHPGGKITTTNGIFRKFSISYTEDYPHQDWEITDSTKNILNIECTKAICNFRGREWTAWFAKSIEIKDGPWKLGGLPGLILEAYDKNGDYVYQATTVKKDNIMPIAFYNFRKENFIDTKREYFLKSMYEYLSGENVDKIEIIRKTLDETNRSKIQKTRKRLLYDFIERDYK